MTDPELEPLEAAVTKLTARAPHKLFVADSARAQERMEAELARQLARLESEYEDDVDDYLETTVFEADGDEIVETNVYPRNAGMASGFYQAIKALRLPSGATVYYETGEWEGSRIRALSARKMDDQAAAELGEIVALPTYFHAGGHLLEIDRHLSAFSGGWISEALLDFEADWIGQGTLDEGEERRAELQEAIDDSWEEGDTDADRLEREQEILDSAPGWFLALTDAQLEEIAGYDIAAPGHTSCLQNKFRPWRKPTREMFLHPDDPVNLQHIVAAYLFAR